MRPGVYLCCPRRRRHPPRTGRSRCTADERRPLDVIRSSPCPAPLPSCQLPPLPRPHLRTPPGLAHRVCYVPSQIYVAIMTHEREAAAESALWNSMASCSPPPSASPARAAPAHFFAFTAVAHCVVTTCCFYPCRTTALPFSSNSSVCLYIHFIASHIAASAFYVFERTHRALLCPLLSSIKVGIWTLMRNAHLLSFLSLFPFPPPFPFISPTHMHPRASYNTYLRLRSVARASVHTQRRRPLPW